MLAKLRNRSSMANMGVLAWLISRWRRGGIVACECEGRGRRRDMLRTKGAEIENQNNVGVIIALSAKA
jgi:hypothetical protein